MTGDATVMRPQPGDIGLTQLRGDVGRLIRLGQWLNRATWKFWTWRKPWKLSRYEHALVCVGDSRIVEAEPGGARETDLTEYDDATIIWLRCPAEYGQAVASAARSLIGTPYSAADYFALAAHRFHLPVPGLRDFIEASGHAICSQLADMAAQLGGWRIFDDGRWNGYVTPMDLAALAAAQHLPPDP